MFDSNCICNGKYLDLAFFSLQINLIQCFLRFHTIKDSLSSILFLGWNLRCTCYSDLDSDEVHSLFASIWIVFVYTSEVSNLWALVHGCKHFISTALRTLFPSHFFFIKYNTTFTFQIISKYKITF